MQVLNLNFKLFRIYGVCVPNDAKQNHWQFFSCWFRIVLASTIQFGLITIPSSLYAIKNSENILEMVSAGMAIFESITTVSSLLCLAFNRTKVLAVFNSIEDIVRKGEATNDACSVLDLIFYFI